MRSWNWTARYAAVLVGAVLLGAALGELAVFKQTTLGTPKLSAAGVVRFSGLGGALTVFWLLGRRAAIQLRENDRARALAFLTLPLVTLLVACTAYDVVLMILRPFLSSSAKDIYNWVFVSGITACAVWLVAALYRHAEELIEQLQGVRRRESKAIATCRFCNAVLSPSAPFCAGCGKAIAQ